MRLYLQRLFDTIVSFLLMFVAYKLKFFALFKISADFD
jgi:hypothetical protein